MDEIRDKVAVLLGKTGIGKSSFINCITQKNVCKIGNSIESCTKKIQQVDIPYNGFNFYFVDTPGLDDGEGDKKNINELDNLKKSYPRINAFIICISFEECRLYNSLKQSLMKFMELFPSASFWDHVLILRTKAERSKKFENKKLKTQGQFFKGIINDNDLINFMKTNNINMPTNLKEFFVDSDTDLDPEELDKGTKKEFELILNTISNIYPIYKEVKEEIKEYTNEVIEGEFSFIHIKTDKIIKFIDFDGKEHETVQQIGDENYNLDGIRPLLVEVKRVQENTPRGILSWSYYFKTHYYLVKFYEIGGERKRVQAEIEWRWEYQDREGEEIPGEDYRRALNDKYNNNSCQV